MKPVNKATVGAELHRLSVIRMEQGQLSLRDEWLFECLEKLYDTMGERKPLGYAGTGKPIFPMDVINNKQEKLK